MYEKNIWNSEHEKSIPRFQHTQATNAGGIAVNLPPETRAKRVSTVFIVAIIIGCLLIGGLLGYVATGFMTGRVSNLQSSVTALEEEISDLQSNSSLSKNVTYENITYILGNNFSLPLLYKKVVNSVVVVQGEIEENSGWPFYLTYYVEVQGSGFVYNSTGHLVILTNYHVIQSATNINVTFEDGNTYRANVSGSDPQADLAVLLTNAPQYEYHPLPIADSSTLEVGDPVIAVGSPLGLNGTMTSGIISALNRTVQVTIGGVVYTISDCIQTTAAINPGNSGGPLLDYQGEVVGITSYTAETAQGTAAQGLGLAIPSDSILQEVGSLISSANPAS
jgi:S1-C subfamily serine protease